MAPTSADVEAIDAETYRAFRRSFELWERELTAHGAEAKTIRQFGKW